MSGRLAILPVSAELLRQALRLPDSVRIDNVALDINRDRLLLRIEGPDFPPVGAAGAIPIVDATFRNLEDGAVEFVGWNK